MTRLLHVDGTAGIAGDMTLGALVDLGVPLGRIAEGLSTLPLPRWSLRSERVVKGGVVATRVHVDIEGDAGEHHHEPRQAPHRHRHSDGHVHDDDGRIEHGHDHDDAPHGRSWPELREAIASSAMSPRVKEAATAVFRRLCEVEAAIHGVPLDEVHLHEAGAADALIDICGACLGLEALDWPEVSCSPPDLGAGSVRCAHGVLPVPSPATLRLLQGFPVTSSGLPVELTTPTGAALLATLSSRWGGLPPMTVEASGFGAGTKDLPDRPNVVRLTLGESAGARTASGSHLLIEADLDDADPQLLASFCDHAREMGALDATLSPVVMKKGRAGTRLTLVATEATREALLEALFRQTTTIGCRIVAAERAECGRTTSHVETPWGPVRAKVASWRGRVVNVKPEHDDLAAIARRTGIPLKEVAAAASASCRTLLEPRP